MSIFHGAILKPTTYYLTQTFTDAISGHFFKTQHDSSIRLPFAFLCDHLIMAQNVPEQFKTIQHMLIRN